MNRYLTGLMALFFIGACSDGGGNGALSSVASTTPENYSGKTVDSLVISPSINDVPVGFSGQFEAVLYFSDDSVMSVTDEVTWHTDENTVASFDFPPYLKAKASGIVGVHASLSGVKSNSVNIRTSDDRLTGLQLTPAQMTIPIDVPFTFEIMGTFASGRVINVTPDVDWRTFETTVAETDSVNMSASSVRASSGSATDVSHALTIDKFGQVTPHARDDMHVQVSVGEVSSNQTSVAVKDVTLLEIQITGEHDANMATGTFMQFHAVGFFDDNSAFDLTKVVKWTSQNPDIALLVEAGYINGAASGQTHIDASWQGISASLPVTVIDKQLVSLQVTPESQTIPVDAVMQFTAIGTFADHSAMDMTDFITWKSDYPAIANMNMTGLATANIIGDVNISASFQGVSNVVTLTRDDSKLERIQITPALHSMWRQTQTPLQAMGFYSDGQSRDITKAVTWRSLDTSKATVMKGHVDALAAGDVSVIARHLGINSNQAKIRVLVGELESIHITPALLELPKEASSQLLANGHYSDGLNHDISQQVAWRSFNHEVATVTEHGQVMAISSGEAVIQAYRQGIVSHEMTIKVIDATLESIQITPADKTVSVALQERFHAMGHYSDGRDYDISSLVAWRSTDSDVASILTDGTTVGLIAGETSVFASIGEVQSNEAKLSVNDNQLSQIKLTPATDEILVGVTKQLQATGVFSDDTQHNINETVSWMSTSSHVATVSDTGLVTGNSIGETRLVAWKEGIKSAESTLTVTHGNVESIQVAPGLKTLMVGSQHSFEATGQYTDNSAHDLTSSSSWRSSAPELASITPEGLVSALAPGEIDISTRVGNAVSNIAKLTVLTGELTELRLSSNAVNMPINSNHQLTVNGLYSSGYHQDISSTATWVSDDTNVVTVSSSGLVTAGANIGGTQITARQGDQSISIQVTVNRGNLTRIAFAEDDFQTVTGMTKGLSVTGYFDTGIEIHDPRYFDWTNTNDNAVSISGSGLVTAVGLGLTSITAKKGDVESDPLVVTVENGSLQNIKVTPENRLLSNNSHHQYHAVGEYTAPSLNTPFYIDITRNVNWQSSITQNATIDANTGLAHATQVGTSVISAQLSNISSNNVDLTITNAELTSIRLVNKAGNDDLSEGSLRRLHAEGVFSDSSVQNIGNKVLWSNNSNVQRYPSYMGAYEAISAGDGLVTIELNGKSATKAINVLPEGSYPCATPTITLVIWGVEKTFHCPDEVSEFQADYGSNYQKAEVVTDKIYAPYKVNMVQLRFNKRFVYCSESNAVLISAGEIRDFFSTLGYSPTEGKFLNLDYGWAFNRTVYTRTPIYGYDNLQQLMLRNDLNAYKGAGPGWWGYAYCVSE